MGRPLVLPPLKRTRVDARRFAEAVHGGQTDKARVPYIEHVKDVARAAGKEAARLGLSDEDQDAIVQMAYLHDVLEPDSRPFGAVTLDDLYAEGFPGHVVLSVLVLTREQGEAYCDYIDRIAKIGIMPAILVKIADLEDNLDPMRLGRLGADRAASLRARYEPALARLRAALAEPTAPR